MQSEIRPATIKKHTNDSSVSRVVLTTLTLTLLLACISHVSYSQLPDFTPPSPEAAALGKYGEIPVNLYNGTTNISIPIYTIKGRDITLPITMSYHSGGIKVEEDASWVGLGWALSSGGVITRAVNGLDDFANGERGWYANPRGFINSPVVPNPSTDPYGFGDYLSKICKQQEDSRPDIFYYNFSGYSGKFILRKKSSPTAPIEVALLSNDKMRINYNEVTKVWTITTIDGTQFQFGTREESQTWYGTGMGYQDVYNTATFPNQMYNARTITAWYLDKIVSPNGEELRFTYKSGNYSSETFTFTELRSMGIPRGDGYPCPGNKATWNGTKTGTFLKYLDRIELTGGQVGDGLRVLFYTTDRNDIKQYDAKIEGVYGKAQRLDKIVIEYLDNGTYRTYRQVKFNSQTDGPAVHSSMWDPFRTRLWLNSLEFQDANSQQIERYRFDYNRDVSLPVKNSTSVDYWGFFNNEYNLGNPARGAMPTRIPALTLISGNQLIPIYGANRKPNEQYAKAGMLTRIHYPTGGFTEFDYELNRYYARNERVFEKRDYKAENNQAVTFELTVPTLVKVTADLRYLGMRCYPDALNQQIAYNAVPNIDLAAYMHPESSPSAVMFNVGYLHYKDCMLTSSNNPSCSGVEFMGHPSARCGVRKVSGDPVNQVMLLQPGRYTLRTNSQPNWLASIRVEYNEEILLSPSTVSSFSFPGGGLRIKEIRNYERAGKLAGRKRYSYTKPVSIMNNGTSAPFAFDDSSSPLHVSSGVNITPLWHHYHDMTISSRTTSMGVGTYVEQWGCKELVSTSYTNLPLSNSAQGALIGYSLVTEEIVGTEFNGTVEHGFINQQDDYSAWGIPQPGAPTKSFSYKNGLLLKTSIRDHLGRVIRSTENNYAASVVENSSYLFSRNTGPCEVGGDCYIPGFTGGNISVSCVSTNPMYFYNFFDITHEFWRVGSTSERVVDYTGSVPAETIKFLTYDHNPDHKLLISEKLTIGGSSGNYVSTKTTYPLDVTTPPAFFISKHIHNRPVEIEKFASRDGVQTKIDGTRYIFSEHTDKGGRVLLDQIQEYNVATSSYETTHHLRYDAFGNVVEIEKDGAFTSIIWGFNNSFPIVKAENVRYTDLQNAFNLNQNLRSTFPNAQITTYNYKRYLGLTTVNDPNEVAQQFDYDNFGRLEAIRNHQGDVVFSFSYNFRK